MFLKLAHLPSKLRFSGKYLFSEHQVSARQLSADSSSTETLYCLNSWFGLRLHQLSPHKNLEFVVYCQLVEETKLVRFTWLKRLTNYRKKKNIPWKRLIVAFIVTIRRHIKLVLFRQWLFSSDKIGTMAGPKTPDMPPKRTWKVQSVISTQIEITASKQHKGSQLMIFINVVLVVVKCL